MAKLLIVKPKGGDEEIMAIDKGEQVTVFHTSVNIVPQRMSKAIFNERYEVVTEPEYPKRGGLNIQV